MSIEHILEQGLIQSSELTKLGNGTDRFAYRVELLLGFLSDSETHRRVYAAQGLALFNREAIPANGTEDTSAGEVTRIIRSTTHGLVQALQDKSEWVRDSAACALANIDSDPELAYPAFTRLLRDRSESMLFYGIVGLGHLGSMSAELVPEISQAIGRASTAGRVAYVIEALSQIVGESFETHLLSRLQQGTKLKECVVPDLLRYLCPYLHLSKWGRQYVATIRQSAAVSNWMVPRITAQLNDQIQEAFPISAARALENFGPVAVSAESNLRRLVESDLRPAVREACARALRSVRGEQFSA